MSAVALSMKGISKAFPGVQALDAASLSVYSGEVHGLVGENGAGKSTIIKVLAGVYQCDAGDVEIDGSGLTILTPEVVHDKGVRFIHQELHLVPHFTVAESVFMGQEVTGLLGLSRREMKRRSEAFLEESLNTSLDGDALIRDLGIAERKLVQIARALIDGKARLVVFDEPTAPLASGETEYVFKAIRALKAQGISMVYVSHYLNEITELCDRVTVFRNGATVAVMESVSSAITDTMIGHMVGRELAAMYPPKQHKIGPALFSISKLSDCHRFMDVNLDVGEGEIVGIAGLIGSGREELVDTLYGLKQSVSGSLQLDGQSLRLRSPAAAVDAGIVLVPRDRRHDGLILDMTVADNVNLASLEEVSVCLMERRGKAHERAEKLAEQLDIRPRNIRTGARLLSGGNQQKVVLARWLATGSKLFILDEPTNGVDVGAKVEIYQLVEELARRGSAVMVSSSDPAELLGLCDRILVLHRGVSVALEFARDLSMDELISLTTAGVRSGHDTAPGASRSHA